MIIDQHNDCITIKYLYLNCTVTELNGEFIIPGCQAKVNRTALGRTESAVGEPAVGDPAVVAAPRQQLGAA